MTKLFNWKKWFGIGTAAGILALSLTATIAPTFGQGAEVENAAELVLSNSTNDLRQAQVSSPQENYLEGRSLDGYGNNLENPELGMAGLPYVRVADSAYIDGLSEMPADIDARFISNRIYNDQAQNLFSENGITHWGFVWGQFLDHSFGLRQTGGEHLVVPFNADDPLEDFTNDLGGLSFERTAAAPGTGEDSPREQINTVSSFIDAFAVYSGSAERLDWLREGSLDGDPTNNSASLLLTVDGYLPTAVTRGNAEEAPTMELMGQLMLNPSKAIIAGDVRANENLGLTAVQTLFAREHNRIVDALPDTLSEEEKFAIARRVVGATQQYITYQEFLPAFGVQLDRYTGYDATVDPTLTNEFATVGYRAHSIIHGEFEMAGDADNYTEAQLENLETRGVEVTVDGDEVEFAIPLNIAFGQPDLVTEIGLDAVLLGLASESEYANDAQMDNQLRSVLFQIPSPDAVDPAACLDGEDLPDCYTVVNDLGVLDMLRSYDHGMPSYNDMRLAYGLEPARSFTDITGEATEQFPNDPLIDANDPLNDPNILDILYLLDANGQEVPIGDETGPLPVKAVQRTTVAARLAAIYGSVDNLDAFTGMMAEEHIAGTDFGELQLAMWTQQFTALRDGDRFFYLNDPVLETIEAEFGISYRQTLADVIVNNTDFTTSDVPANVFHLPAAAAVENNTPSQPNSGQSRPDPAASGQRNLPNLRPVGPNNAPPPTNRPNGGEICRPEDNGNGRSPRGNNR